MKFVSRRSPFILPRPLRAEDSDYPTEMLARLAFGAAWRPRALAGSLASALSRVPGGPPQAALLVRVSQGLATSSAFADVATTLGVADVERLLQARLEHHPLPTAASWAEVALADVLYGEALDRSLSELKNSQHEGVARAASLALEREASFGRDVVKIMAADAPNRECLQILIDRWLPHAVRVFGRPDAAGEPELLESRSKSRPSREQLVEYLEDIEVFLTSQGLWIPDAERMGVQVPGGWMPRPFKG